MAKNTTENCERTIQKVDFLVVLHNFFWGHPLHKFYYHSRFDADCEQSQKCCWVTSCYKKCTKAVIAKPGRCCDTIIYD